LNCANSGDSAGTKPRLRSLRVAAKTRFRVDDWMDEAEVEAVLTELLMGHAGEPVTVGDHTTVDGTECGYLLRMFFQARPLLWEVELVEVTYSGAGGRDDAAGRGGTLRAGHLQGQAKAEAVQLLVLGTTARTRRPKEPVSNFRRTCKIINKIM
jgi:hypothetical protein